LGFQVQSEGKTPIHNYTILNISYDNYAIIPRDTDMLHGNGCPRDSHNVSFGSELLSYTNSFDSLKFFFDCYSKPGDDLPPDFQNCQIKLQRVKPIRLQAAVLVFPSCSVLEKVTFLESTNWLTTADSWSLC
jgi:hypothetical protein